MKSTIRMYLGYMRLSILQQFQYPVRNYFYMVGMIAEPIIYLVVWQTVARARGGAVGGFTAGEIAAYYIVWTLVRNMNIVLTPYAWENRIQRGQLSGQLLRPIHPLHIDLAYFTGWKFVVIAMWLPIAAVLILVFQPAIQLSLGNVAAFVIALWGGFLVRFMLQWALGMLSFWTTRVNAVFQLYFTIELLLSGRFVPLSFLPDWAQSIAGWLPFKWAFGYPIEVILGRWSPQEIFFGFAMQAVWVLIGLAIIALVWRAGVSRFSSVGN
jgi:ABC-2 type transport system permease protein